MTASVIATEAAQIASKKASSKKIGETVVQGFFGLIQGEIAQQMTELASAFPPKLQELKNFALRCVSLRKQMELDFHRIQERYDRLFGELDRELRLRIKTLDRAAFLMQQECSDPTSDCLKTSQITTPVLSGSEIQIAQTQIASYTIRQRALAMISSSHEHIASGVRLSETLGSICDDVSADTSQQILIPVLLVEQDEFQGEQKMHLLSSQNQPFGAILENQNELIIEQTDIPSKWSPMPKDTRIRIEEHLSKFILKGLDSSNDIKSQREASMIKTLWDNMSISSMQGA
jgi:hypothetical protein